MMSGMGPRVQAIVLLLLVATSGALAGIVGDRLLSDRGDATPRVTSQGGGGGPWRLEARPAGRYAERLGDMLELNAEQRSAIDAIVAEEQARVRALTAEVQPRFRAIAAETRDRIEDVLTAEQRERLRAMRSERMRALGRPDARWRGDTPGPRPDDDVRGRRFRDGDSLRGDDAGMLRERRERMRERMTPRPPGDSAAPGTVTRGAAAAGRDA